MSDKNITVSMDTLVQAAAIIVAGHYIRAGETFSIQPWQVQNEFACALQGVIQAAEQVGLPISDPNSGVGE
jgi:hypothetical protein